MPRQRLRPDYQRRNYTYHCTIVGEPPPILWETARAMQQLWNGLVTQHEALIAPWDVATDRPTKQAAYARFWAQAYTSVRDEGERLGLPVWCKWHIYDTFQSAQRRWAQGKGGRPKAHHGLHHLILPHRTQSGGVPLAWLWTDHDRKHTAVLPAEPPHHHRPAYFTLGEQRVPLRVLVHRLPPEGAILKRIALLGTWEPSLRKPGDTGWRWRFQLTVEEPPPVPQAPVGRSGGLDLGWRVLEHGLRVAVLTDGQREDGKGGTICHAWELVIPWDGTNAQLRWRLRGYAKAGIGLEQLETTRHWQRLWAWQATIDQQVETCKQTLATLDHGPWPDEARHLWHGQARLRAGGLRRLARLLQAAGVACPVLEAWEAQHTVSQRRWRGAYLTMLAQREALYRRFADWVARHFDTVAWEGDLGLKAMAETRTDQYALEAGKRYRHMAGLTQLRRFLREALAKRGRQLIDVPSAGTSRQCSVQGCAGVVRPGPRLEYTCSQGHRDDQDLNSALNLWYAMPPVRRGTTRAVPEIDREELRKALTRLA